MVQYRKMRSGKEFMKVMSETKALSVYNTNRGCRIQLTTNSMVLKDYISDEFAIPSTEDEFNKAYYKAMAEINRLKIEY